MNPRLIGGIVLLVIGTILFFVGLNASDSIADQTSNFFTGTYTDRTMWYIIGGAVLAISGLGLLILGRSWARV